jgi:hypothetical protein
MYLLFICDLWWFVVCRFQRMAVTTVSLAFGDAQVIPPFSMEETDDRDDRDDADHTDDTNDKDDTDDTNDTLPNSRLNQMKNH